MRVVVVLACILSIAGCRSGRMAWVEDVPVVAEKTCRGGTINTERRVVSSTIVGTVRNTTTRVDACLD
jgi:hypothetical protein